MIREGDLVMVVRGHKCVLDKVGGIPYRVIGITSQTGGGWHCPVCGEFNIAKNEKLAATFYFHSHPDSGIPFGWLKRIDPLPAPSSIDTPVEVEHG